MVIPLHSKMGNLTKVSFKTWIFQVNLCWMKALTSMELRHF
jgi:hypothetical protein